MSSYVYDSIRFVEAIRKHNPDVQMEYFGNSNHLILVNGEYIVSPGTKTWRVNGKTTWYQFKTPKQFVDRFLSRKVFNKQNKNPKQYAVENMRNAEEPVSIDGKAYDSIKDAAFDLGEAGATIAYWIKNGERNSRRI